MYRVGTYTIFTGRDPFKDLTKVLLSGLAISRLKRGNEGLKETLDLIIEDPSVATEEKIKSIIKATSVTCAYLDTESYFNTSVLQMTMVYYLHTVIKSQESANFDIKKLATVLFATAGVTMATSKALSVANERTPREFTSEEEAWATALATYANTYAIGVSASYILKDRSKNKQSSDEITEKEKTKIKEIFDKTKVEIQKENLTMEKLFKELAKIKDKVDDYKSYREKVEDIEDKADANNKIIAELEQKLQETEEIYSQLATENEEENVENKKQIENLKIEIERLAQEKEQLKAEQDKNFEIQYSFYEERMKIYKNIVFEKKSLKEFTKLSSKESLAVEEQIGLLNYEPEKVKVRDKIHGTDFLEIGFMHNHGRMYYKNMGAKHHIYKIGKKTSQKKDIATLKSWS